MGSSQRQTGRTLSIPGLLMDLTIYLHTAAVCTMCQQACSDHLLGSISSTSLRAGTVPALPVRLVTMQGVHGRCGRPVWSQMPGGGGQQSADPASLAGFATTGCPAARPARRRA